MESMVYESHVIYCITEQVIIYKISLQIEYYKSIEHVHSLFTFNRKNITCILTL